MKVNNSAGCRLSSTSLLACGRPGSAIAAAISGDTACAPRTVAVDDSNKAVRAAARRAVRFVIFDPPGIRRRTLSAIPIKFSCRGKNGERSVERQDCEGKGTHLAMDPHSLAVAIATARR